MSLTSSDFLIIGHRGAAGLAPENTLPGFRAAFGLHVDAIELDVHLVDETLVVIHDDTVDRTTNGTGALRTFDLDRLRRLDAGNGASIPTLNEVLAIIPKGCAVNVELKGQNTAPALVACLDEHPQIETLISSFDHDLLYQFRELDTARRVAPLFNRWREDCLDVARSLNAWSVNLNQRHATAHHVEMLRGKEMKVLCYTVNDIQRAAALRAMGVDGVFTDRPDTLVGLRNTDRIGSTRDGG